MRHQRQLLAVQLTSLGPRLLPTSRLSSAHRPRSLPIPSSPAVVSLRSNIRALNTTPVLNKGKGKAAKKEPENPEDKRWSHTIQLPRTKFEIRANAAKRDALFHQRTCQDLYRWQLARPAQGSESGTDAGPSYVGDFVFHDGPPYANGSLHCGHAMNKIVKDIANRYQLLRGKRVHFMPGWDCHGLPIEMKALAHLRAQERDALTASAIRKRAREEAEASIETQKAEFNQFGVMADWSPSATYRTLDPAYEARQLRIFGEMARRGLIYRRFRPVYWSPSNRTALAEAELEYREDHLSKAAYVKFDLLPGPTLQSRISAAGIQLDAGAKAVIWTTTPWSLASNMAINVNAEMDYSFVRREATGEVLLVATDRVEAVAELTAAVPKDDQVAVGKLTELLRIRGSDLLDSSYKTPLMGTRAAPRPILAADYVTAISGTGLVHSAPAHGAEDYDVWRSHGLLDTTEIFSPIDDLGRYTADLEQLDDEADRPDSISRRLIGKEVLGDGAKEVLQILSEKGALLSAHTLRHKYPYDWRSKLPVIVRATSQWFANLDQIKDAAIKALEGVRFVPESSRTRLESFVRGRSEWCISRQRVWGVPIPVVYDAATDEPLLTGENIDHIAALLEDKGTDYWWQADVEELVAPQYRSAGKHWRKGEDTVDVWFDSGTSWATARDSLPADVQEARKSGPVADVYLEGSDQHRGWFQSSLLTAVATTPEGQAPVAPFKTVVTHGYVLDKDSRKMSKSLGNTISPLTIVNGGKGADQPAYGIDVLRLWAARSDYTTDLPIGTLIVGKASEALRKLRNTARFMLANLPRSDEVAPLDVAKMSLADRYAMHELYALETACAQAYEAFDYAQVVRRVTEFANGTLSTLYLDIAKDCLYIEAPNSEARTSMVSVIDHILRTFTAVLAPIAPFLAEDIHHYRNGAEADPSPDGAANEATRSVFVKGWQGVDARWKDDALARDVEHLLRLRNVSLALIEEARQAGDVKTAFEVEVDILIASGEGVDGALGAAVQRYESQLTRLFNVARVNVRDPSQGEHNLAASWSRSQQMEAATLGGKGVEVRVRPSSRTRCPRCRTFRKEKPEDELCLRCADVVAQL